MVDMIHRGLSSISDTACKLSIALILALAVPVATHAQLGTAFPGFVTLPQNDFTWIWGDPERDLGRRPDFDSRGFESSFRCELTGSLRPSSRLTELETRNMEQSLSSSLSFIQEAAQTMNVLDQSLDLQWARLDCQKPPPTEASAEKQQERVDRAVEKALRDRERRRARRAEEEAR